MLHSYFWLQQLSGLTEYKNGKALIATLQQYLSRNLLFQSQPSRMGGSLVMSAKKCNRANSVFSATQGNHRTKKKTWAKSYLSLLFIVSVISSVTSSICSWTFRSEALCQINLPIMRSRRAVCNRGWQLALQITDHFPCIVHFLPFCMPSVSHCLLLANATLQT